jgi:hypothetical protein
MKCPTCNFENPGEVKSCLICGADMVKQPTQPPPPTAPPPQEPGKQPPEQSKVTKEQPKTPQEQKTQEQYQIKKKGDVVEYSYHDDPELLKQYMAGEGYDTFIKIGIILIIIGIIIIPFTYNLIVVEYSLINILITSIGFIFLGAGIIVVITNYPKYKRGK